MKLCIPVIAPNGLESNIEPHLPHAEYLLFFDTESRVCHEISLREQQEGAGENVLMDAVLCGSINRITLRTLIEQGIPVYGTEAQTVAEAIAQFENGELESAVSGVGGCSGHDHSSGEHSCQGECHGEEGGGCCADRAIQHEVVEERILGDEFKIAVCSQNRKTVTEHAGKCRKFWVYEVGQGQVIGKTLLELSLAESLHAAPAGLPHPLDDMSVLISGSIGSGLLQRLMQLGIRSVVTTETDPDQAVSDFLTGKNSSAASNQVRCAHGCSTATAYA